MEQDTKNQDPSQDPTSPELGADWPEVDSNDLDEGDKSLVRSMLERTPMGRLTYLQELVDGLVALRHGRTTGQ